jgi:hypothetical protein
LLSAYLEQLAASPPALAMPFGGVPGGSLNVGGRASGLVSLFALQAYVRWFDYFLQFNVLCLLCQQKVFQVSLLELL